MQPVDTVSLEPYTESPFRIGPAVIEPPLHQIRLGERTHKVEPRVMRVLLCLAARPGHPVTREALLNAVWPDALPNDEGLTQAVCKLRKAFGDRATRSAIIETIPKVGYRLIAPVSALPLASNDQANIASNGQVDPPEASREHGQTLPRAPLPAATFSVGYRQAEWRWLAVCFALLMVFCALWASYVAPRPVPAEQRQVFIHRLGSDPTAGVPGTMRIMVRKYQTPPTWHQKTNTPRRDD